MSAGMKEKVSELILSAEYRDAWKMIEEMRREKKHPAFVDLAGAVCLLAFGHVRQAEEWLDSCEQSGPEFYYLDALIHLHAGRPERHPAPAIGAEHTAFSSRLVEP